MILAMQKQPYYPNLAPLRRPVTFACADVSKSSVYTHRMVQPQKKDGRFRNYSEGHPFRHQIEALLIGWKTLIENIKRIFLKSASYGNVPSPVSLKPYNVNLEGLSTQWIGHATSLIQMGGFNILTDPIFGNIGGLYQRKSKPGILPNNLPPIDALAISHTHRDHLDIPSLRQLLKAGCLKPDTLIVAPVGTELLFKRLGFTNIQQFSGWWSPIELKSSRFPGKALAITPVAARHWSGRTGIDTNKSPWAGFVFQASGKTAYYAGDTAYDQTYFQAIKEKFPSIDLALLPIGPCEPRKQMKGSHMDPAEAVNALKTLCPKKATAVHYGTYGLGPDKYKTPIELVNRGWTSECSSPELQKTDFQLLQIGGRLDVI
jgi:L-ascorbate metabolism protein UlaG (beta-lactamase superfamily)